MTPQRFQQVRNLFEAALERGTSERAAFVAGACQNDQELQEEVGRLLEARDATVTLAMPPASPQVRTDPGSREGRRLGDYEILRELGRGGMGAVYLARRADQAFQKNVAIKILRSEAASADIVRRFQREREILAQLDHPNIARLLDAGSTEDGLPYFVMEYVEGRSITDYADEQRLPMRERIDLFRQVCDAVEYAHQRNIVHRDLKPGNVLVTAAGQVKLLDFGIARLVERAEAEAGGAALTQSGMWLMTPEYASPEQVRGEAAGRESDVYSLGVILFELLTGHRPYHLRKRIFHEIVRVVCEEPPTRPSMVITQLVESTTADGKPTTLPPETAGRLRQTSLDDLKQQLSGNLDNIVLKALQKQPQDRYASPMQLRADIDRHLRGEGVWARSDSFWYWMGRVLSRYAVALVLVAATAAAVSTGAVKVSRNALWWVAGAVALIGLWRAATDREIGRRIASHYRWFLPLALIAVIGLSIRFSWNPQGMQNANLAVIGLLTIYSLAAWIARARTGGPLVLDISKKANRVLQLGRALSVLLMASLIWRHPNVIRDDPGFIWFYAFLSLLLFIGARQEIRRDGLIRGGTLIRWSRIASWSWEDNLELGWQNSKVLVLHLHRRIQFLPPARMTVQASQRDQVEAILARQLGEWPVAGADKVPILPSPAPSFMRVWGWRIGLLAIPLVVVWLYPRYVSFGSREARSYPTGREEARAVGDAATRFHDAFSQGRYADACQVAEPGAFRGITSLPCPEFLAWVHDQIGAVVDAKWVNSGQSGKRVRMEFATHHVRGESREVFEWLISEGQTRLTSYSISFQPAP